MVSVDFLLTTEEIATLEATYRPHPPVGVMAQNTKEASSNPKVRSK